MDFWSFIDRHITPIFTVLGTIGGAFIGGYFTSKSQKSILSEKIQWDKEKEKRNQAKETLAVYNKVLEIDGITQIIEHNGGHRMEFLEEDYNIHIRPVLFEKYHQLHENVAGGVDRIDRSLSFYNFHEEITKEEEERLAKEYFDLIQCIKSHLENHRKSEMDV